MTAPVTSGISDATQPGIFHAYASLAASSVTAGATCVSVTVSAPGWYDVETTIHNNSATDGALLEDEYNFGLFSDPVTAATMKLARKLPVRPWKSATPGVTRDPAIKTRVYAQTTITIVSESGATASTNWLLTLTAHEVFVPTDTV